jgi:hypothetical protein
MHIKAPALLKDTEILVTLTQKIAHKCTVYKCWANVGMHVKVFNKSDKLY